ncbi:DUF6165 family protein [Phenylobacterium sp.]|jgi:hypothetical protein|uniref:DUF6165 family protein n=1 Tax=Phenylobacterium sp. TaxID=1871053 RepID=UPI002E3037FC|nr:DUF6165 family protein [Phenylobacterium sp.]HEX3366494.1 DUF6165 family protein [Phenylobacterium sp.]
MPDAPVSWGELIDKISILEIKGRRLTEAAALANVRRELAALEAAAAEVGGDPRLAGWRAALGEVNEALWEIEDAIREQERAGDFGPRFIELARSVYRRNDVRTALKREINLALGSELIEEKSYSDYNQEPLP